MSFSLLTPVEGKEGETHTAPATEKRIEFSPPAFHSLLDERSSSKKRRILSLRKSGLCSYPDPLM